MREGGRERGAVIDACVRRGNWDKTLELLGVGFGRGGVGVGLGWGRLLIGLQSQFWSSFGRCTDR